MSTFLPDRILHIIAGGSIAADHPGLSNGSMLALAEIHRSRGELLSAEQYEDMVREEVEDEAVLRG